MFVRRIFHFQVVVCVRVLHDHLGVSQCLTVAEKVGGGGGGGWGNNGVKGEEKEKI